MIQVHIHVDRGKSKSVYNHITKTLTKNIVRTKSERKKL